MNIVADYIPPSSESKFLAGGSLIGDLALSLVALYLFKPTDVFDTFAKRKSDC